MVAEGPCEEASAGRQRPCTSRSVPTRALCFPTQIVIITRSSEKLLKIGPRGHVAPRGEGRNRTEKTHHYAGRGSRLGRGDTSLRRARVPPIGNPCRLEGRKGEGRVFEELYAIIHTFSPGLSRVSEKISPKKQKLQTDALQSINYGSELFKNLKHPGGAGVMGGEGATPEYTKRE